MGLEPLRNHIGIAGMWECVRMLRQVLGCQAKGCSSVLGDFQGPQHREVKQELPHSPRIRERRGISREQLVSSHTAKRVLVD